MSKINTTDFISEMIKGYKSDRAVSTALSLETQVETASKTADNIEDKLTANESPSNVSRETITTEKTEEKGELDNEDN